MYGNSFFNPYMYQPYQTANLARNFGNISNLAKTTNTLANTNTNLTGIRSLLRKISFSSLLDGTSKTLNVVNQAIPIFYQVKPMFNNAKTMFRILGAIKEDNNTNKNIKTTTNLKNNVNYSNTNSNNYDNFNEENPTFFI